MKKLLVAGAFLLATLSAQAGDRTVNIAGMSCSKVQSVVQQSGAAILHYKNAQGLKRHGRYVKSDEYCKAGETAVGTSVPTKDAAFCDLLACRVKTGIERFFGGGNQPGGQQGVP